MAFSANDLTKALNDRKKKTEQPAQNQQPASANRQEAKRPAFSGSNFSADELSAAIKERKKDLPAPTFRRTRNSNVNPKVIPELAAAAVEKADPTPNSGHSYLSKRMADMGMDYTDPRLQAFDAGVRDRMRAADMTGYVAPGQHPVVDQSSPYLSKRINEMGMDSGEDPENYRAVTRPLMAVGAAVPTWVASKAEALRLGNEWALEQMPDGSSISDYALEQYRAGKLEGAAKEAVENYLDKQKQARDAVEAQKEFADRWTGYGQSGMEYATEGLDRNTFGGLMGTWSLQGLNSVTQNLLDVAAARSLGLGGSGNPAASAGNTANTTRNLLASTAAENTGQLAGKAARLFNYVPFAERSFGASAGEARRANADLSTQLDYAVANTVKEVVTEMMWSTGDIFGVGGFDDLAENGIKSLVRKSAVTGPMREVLSTAASLGMAFTTEAIEEGVGTLVEEFYLKQKLDPNAKPPTGLDLLKTVGESMMVGGLSGMMMGGGNVLSQNLDASINQTRARAAEIIEAAESSGSEEAKALAKKVKENADKGYITSDLQDLEQMTAEAEYKDAEKEYKEQAEERIRNIQNPYRGMETADAAELLRRGTVYGVQGAATTSAEDVSAAKLQQIAREVAQAEAETGKSAPVRQAVQEAKSGGVSEATAEEILKSPRAAEFFGVDVTDNTTEAERINTIRAAAESIAEEESLNTARQAVKEASTGEVSDATAKSILDDARSAAYFKAAVTDDMTDAEKVEAVKAAVKAVAEAQNPTAAKSNADNRTTTQAGEKPASNGRFLDEIKDTLGKSGQSEFVRVVSAPKHSMSVQELTDRARAAAIIYNAGKNGAAIESIRIQNNPLTADEMSAMYSAGVNDGRQSGIRTGERQNNLAASERSREISQRARETRARRQGATVQRTAVRAAVENEAAVSPKEIGFRNGSDTKNLKVLPESAYSALNKHDRTAVEQLKKKGFKVVLMVSADGNGIGGLLEDVQGKRYRGAIQDGNTIFLSADHWNYTVEQIARHEYFHSVLESNAGLRSAIVSRLYDQFSAVEILNMQQAYAEDYNWSGVDADYVLDEILCDAFGGMDVFEDKHLFPYHVTDYAEIVREMAKGTEAGVTAKQGETKFSLEMFEDGTKFVNVQTDQSQFDGLSLREKAKLAEKVINEKFRGRVIGTDNRTYVDRASSREYVHSAKRSSFDSYQAKLHAATELDNLVDAGTNFRHEDDGKGGHFHKDNVGGFDYYDTIFKVANDYYKGLVNIELVAKGKRLKDVTKIENITEDIYRSYGENPKTIFLRDTSIEADQLMYATGTQSQAPHSNVRNAAAMTSKENIAQTEDEGNNKFRGSEEQMSFIDMSEDQIKLKLEKDLGMGKKDAAYNAKTVSGIGDIYIEGSTFDGKPAGRTLAVAFREELIQDGHASLIGKQVRNAKDLATLAQVYRNPRFETMRYFFTNDAGEVVYHTGISCGLVSASALAPSNAFMLRMIKEAKAAGATKAYALHNHPSGDPTPSGADIQAQKRLDNFFARHNIIPLGGVIINSNKYATYGGGHRTNTLSLGDGVDQLLSPVGQKKLVGMTVNTLDELANLAKAMQISSDYSAVIYLGAKLNVNAIQEVHNSIASDEIAMTEWVENNRPKYGAVATAFVTNNADCYDTLTDLMRDGLAVDVVRADIGTQAARNGVTQGSWLGSTMAVQEVHFSEEKDASGRTLSEGQQKFFKDSKVRDAEGRLIPVYHGTGRMDRVGTVFRADRATSGPMSFFTDSRTIAENYSRDKQDTSIAYDERYQDYYTQFRVNKNGKDISVSELWNKLTQKEKNKILTNAQHITMDWDTDDIIYDKSETRGLGNWDQYLLRENNGNALKALTQSWLEDGNLYGNESDFLEVLRLAGVEDVEYYDPDARQEGVYEEYLNITNPFDAISDVTEDFVRSYESWYEQQDSFRYETESAAADMWDKRSVSADVFAERMRDDIKNGTSRAWTSIPDSMSDYLRSLGYDGIMDQGGKNGGEGHTVWIPFDSNQIKNVDNLNPTENPDIRYSEESSIRPDMTEEERYEVLKDRNIRIVASNNRAYWKKLSPEDKTKIRSGSMKESKTVLKRYARNIGVLKEYHHDGTGLNFTFSGNNFDESIFQQSSIKINNRYVRFGKMLSCLDEIVAEAQHIESHMPDKEIEDKDLKQIHVFASAYRDGKSVVPVKLLVKEFYKKPNALYVTMIFDKTKEITFNGQSLVEISPQSAISEYRLADLLREVKNNPQSIALGKYVPVQFAEAVNEETAHYSEEPSTFSARMQQSQDELERLQQDLSLSQAEVAYWKQARTTGTHVVNKADVKRVSADVIKRWESTLKPGEITDRMTELAECLYQGMGMDEVIPLALEIADDLCNSARIVTDSAAYAEYQRLKKFVRSHAIKRSSDVDDPYFYKRNFGKIRFTNDGTPMDIMWGELQSEFGKELFPDEVSTIADKMLHLADVLESIEPVFENPYSANYAEAVEECAYSLMNDIMRGGVRYEPVMISSANGKAASEYNKTIAEKNRQIEQLQKANEKTIEYYKEREARAKELLKQVRDRRDERIAELKRHYKEVAMSKKWRKAESDARKKLLRVAKRLQNRKLPAVSRALLGQYIDDLDTAALSITGAKLESLKDLQVWYSNKKATDPDFIANPEIEKKLARINKKRISELSIAEVVELTQVLLNIENTINTERKMIDTEDRRDVYAMGLEAIDNIQSSRGTKADLKDWIVSNTLSPVRAVKRFTGYAANDPLYRATEALADGQRRMFDYQMRAYRMFDTWAKDRKYTKSLQDTIKIQGFRNGVLVDAEITKDMAIALYMHAKNDQNLAHIRDGGVTIPDLRALKKDPANAYGQGATRIKLSPAMVKAIESKLTAQDKAYAAAAAKYFDTMAQNEINEVSEKLVGYSLAQVENYFPINTDSNFTRKEFESLQMDGTIEGMGFLKERTDAKNPIYLRGFTDVLNKSIDMNSKYVGLAIPVRNFNKLWNVTTADYSDADNIEHFTGSVKEAMNKKWGKRGVNYIEKMMTDLQNANVKSDELDSLLGKVRSNYAGAVLTLNLSVAIKQAASYPTAGAVLGGKALAKALANPKVDANLIAKYTPLYWYRSQGFADQELGDLKSRNKQIPKLLNWIQAADMATTKTLWKASEYYVRDNSKDLQIGTDAYYQEVARIYNRVIEETQPNYTTMQRPQLLRSDSSMVQSIAMFKTQPFQNFNVLYDAVGEYEALARAKKAGADVDLKPAARNVRRAIGSQVVQLAVFSAMTFIWNMIRRKHDKYEDEEGEMTAASTFKGIGKDMLSGSFSMVPFGSNLYELMDSIVNGSQYYGFDSVTITALDDTATSIINQWELVKDATGTIIEGGTPDWNTFRIKTKKNLNKISKLAGIPMENVNNLYEAAYHWATIYSEGEYMGEYRYLTLTVSPASSKVKYYALLKKAWLNDKKAFNQLQQEMLDSGYFTEKGINQKISSWKKELGM